jgi:hypothetical protein
MSLTASDLKHPNGEMQSVMFPDNDIDTLLAAWLIEAQGKTAIEEAQKRWVYYKGYTAIANRIAATPSSQSHQGTQAVSWSDSRIQQFRSLARDHLAEYQRLAGADVLDGRVSASLRVY